MKKKKKKRTSSEEEKNTIWGHLEGQYFANNQHLVFVSEI